MWLALLVLSLLAAGVHLNSMPVRPKVASAELVLIYLLAGYCGFAQIIRSIAVLVRGQPLMEHVQFTPGDPAVVWLGFFGLGCGLIGVISIWRRGTFFTRARYCLGGLLAWNHACPHWTWRLEPRKRNMVMAALDVCYTRPYCGSARGVLFAVGATL